MFAQSEILTFSLMDVICLPSAPTLCVIRGRGEGVLLVTRPRRWRRGGRRLTHQHAIAATHQSKRWFGRRVCT